MCILGRVACRVGALGEFPHLSVGLPTAGGGGAAVALCPSLVGCKGQHCSVAWQGALVATAAAQVSLAYMCSCVHGLGTCETQNADYGMPHRTASAAWTAMPSYLPSHSGLTSPSTGAHAEVSTPQYINIAQYTHTCICTCYLKGTIT